MSLEKDFVPYQESLELKELEFDEPCIMQWTYAPELIFCTSTWGHPKLKTNKESYSDSGGDCISAPTFSQAFRWFREKHKLNAISPTLLMYTTDWAFRIIDLNRMEDVIGCKTSNSYEEAELACLRKLIEITKEKQHDVQTN